MRDSKSARNVSSSSRLVSSRLVSSRLVCSFVSPRKWRVLVVHPVTRSLVSNELLFAFLQGGPCGVLASVQGFVLKHLLFGVNKGDVKKYVEVCSLCAERKSLFQPTGFCIYLLLLTYIK